VLPSQLVQPVGGIDWLVDVAAASRLTQ